MSKITSLMTSLHEGHKAEERIKCIDTMLDKCKDTKFTVLQAFWWYRKYTKAKLEKLDKIEQIIDEWNDDFQASQKDLWMFLADIKEVLE